MVSISGSQQALHVSLKHSTTGIQSILQCPVKQVDARQNNDPPGSRNHVAAALVFTSSFTPVSYAHAVGSN